MKTAYHEIHERAYRLRRADGRGGWNQPGELDATLAALGAALDEASLPANARVLELGCGAGDMTVWLARRGYHVSGVDISETAIAWSREKLQSAGIDADVRVGDVRTLEGFDDGTFDLVVDAHLLHCIVGADRAVVLTRAARLLRPSGCLQVLTMCGDDHNALQSALDLAAAGVLDPESRVLVRDGIAGRYFGRAEDIAREMHDVGLEVVAQRVFPAPGPRDVDELVLTARKRP